MRPVKDLVLEEYWNIGYRTYTDSDSVVNGKGKYKFDLIKASKRYWYADPFLFEKDGETYLFVEVFDNKMEKGHIGCSRYVNGAFTEPVPVLTEKFHLSYPYVFEKDSEVYMMPESHEDNCIQLYRAVDFPNKWVKDRVLIADINNVDTVMENDLLITSAVCPENDMSIDLRIYDADGNECPCSPVYKGSFTKRGAGKVFDFKNMRIRPAQGCENGVYGGKLIFNKINECTPQSYSEEEFSEITPDNIETDIMFKPSGIHTYARTGKIEIVDIKFKRTNVQRLKWIIRNKI